MKQASGPGNYGHYAQHVHDEVEADATILIVLRGEKGSGFSVIASEGLYVDLVALLRSVADAIERGDDLMEDNDDNATDD